MVLRLYKSNLVAKNTLELRFDKPQNFEYLPGQFIYLTLPFLKNDYRGPTRQFTLSSSPTENYLAITTKIRSKSNFKKSLLRLKKGIYLESEGPSGTFVLDEQEKGKHVLIAGGIGITPFRSILKYHFDRNINKYIHLLYSNSYMTDIAFRDELTIIAKKRKNLRVTFSITKDRKYKNWKGLTGRIDGSLIKKLEKNIKTCTFWICGPEGMVISLKNEIKNLGIHTSKIRTEEFSGY